VKTCSAPSRAFGILALFLLAGGTVNAEHGNTADLEESRKAFEKRFSGEVLNEKLPQLWSEDGKELFIELETAPGKRQWHAVSRDSGETRPLDKKPDDVASNDRPESKQPSSSNASQSPDKRHSVEIRDGQLILESENSARVLSAAPDDPAWHWESRIQWAPDSSRFVAWKNTDHPVHEVHYVRSSPEDQLQPEHFTKSYPKPGDALNVAHPVVFFLDGGDPIEVEPSLIKDPYSLREARWRADSQRFTLEFIERGFGRHRIIEINSATRKQRCLIDEHDEKFVFVFGNSFRRDLNDGDEILWLSERDDWNHLYLIDGLTGKVIRQLTKGPWLVREVVEVFEKERSAIVSLGGYYEKQDPYHLHFARIDFDDGKLTLLTDGDGTHQLSWAPDRKHYVATWSRVDHPPVHELRRASDGKKLATLASGSTTELEAAGWQKPQRFVTTDRNDEYSIHGMILRPSDFDPEKSYPVIEAIYAGPHGSFTPKSWKVRHGVMTEMAEAGFIVVKLDALGTNHRGRKFQQVAYKNLIDSGFPDRIKWIRAAAKEIPQMDLERVGIYGGSAGGQSTLAALLTHSGFYRAGAADCGCHDNRMDKIWWNEQWMDWPVDDSYISNSNVTHADKLQGHLLLTVGEVDTNVDPASTLQVVDALIRADKDFDFLIVPNGGHGVGEKPYLRRKRIEFFQQHLGEPR
jgi:dipeptidyl aminopeptidase/acylaminoacyl peptidase